MDQHRHNEFPIPETMKAWVLGNPEELALVEKPVPEPGPAEVLVRVDAIAVCATDIEILRLCLQNGCSHGENIGTQSFSGLPGGLATDAGRA